MKKFCFNGCSFTVGEGFEPTDRTRFIYDKLITKALDIESVNIAQIGSSNYEIFMRSAAALNQNFDIIVVQWSALNRLILYPGPDGTFSCNDGIGPFDYRDIHLSESITRQMRELMRILNHDYHNLLDLIEYCSILDRLASLRGVKIVYVNGLVPWCDDLIKPLGNNLASSLSDYSKEILDFDNRDDAEIRFYFEKLQKQFEKLDQSKWVNLFESFRRLCVDKGPLGHHPGIESHKLMSEKILNYLNETNLV